MLDQCQDAGAAKSLEWNSKLNKKGRIMTYPSSKAAFFFHLAIGLITLGLMFGIGTFIFTAVGKSTFPWWVYPAFALYSMLIVGLDHILFSKPPVECRDLKSANS
jgi:hypothetical protein